MSERLIIRRARSDEGPALAQAQRVIARTPGQLASTPGELRDEDFTKRIAALNTSERGLFVVAELDGVVVGHALLDPLKLAVTSHVVSLTIAVHEGAQGRGVGRQLMTYLVDWARVNAGVEKVELQVRSANARAIALYRSLGFVEEGRKTKRLKLSDGRYLDDVYMALWVGP